VIISSSSGLDNGNPSHLQKNHHTNIGLPPPESTDELLTKKKKRFGQRKKAENQNNKLNLPCPPKFIQMDDRTFSFGDNSFDADNAAYNLYGFIVRIKDVNMIWYILFFFFIVSLWRHWWWTLCCIC
jgi:hypothetical protein